MTLDPEHNKILEEMFDNAIDKTEGETLYSNTVRVHVGESEIILEFYLALPGGLNQKPSLLHRTIIPLSLGEKLSELLSAGISSVEQNKTLTSRSD